MDYYYSFNRYLSRKFNRRLWRIPLSTGYPCPNRIDGKTGCAFCNGESFLPRYLRDNDTLENQLLRGMKFFAGRYHVNDFYGYFQDNTGTYGDPDDLEGKYRTVLAMDNMKGVMISTRPDCIYPGLVCRIRTLQEEFNKDVWIELGLQSVNDAVLKRINRNHTYEDFKNAVRIIKDNSDVKVTVHIIIGLPGERPDDIRTGIKKLFLENEIDGIKFRLLEVLPGTKMEEDFRENPDDFFKFYLDSYCALLCNLLEIIPQDVVIMRLVNFKSLQLLGNDFAGRVSKLEVLNRINGLFEERKTKQGIYC